MWRSPSTCRGKATALRFPDDLAIGLAGAVILWLGIMPEPLLRVISSIVAALPEPG